MPRTSENQLASLDRLIVSVGSRIANERAARDWSARELGRRAGCSSSAIHRAEALEFLPQVCTLTSICLAFGIEFADLLGSPEDYGYGGSDV